MHPAAYEELAKFAAFLAHDMPLRIGDIGAYNVNGCLRPLFDTPRWTYQGLDTAAGPNVDVVLPTETDWNNIADDAFDVIVTVSTLEHTRRPWRVVSEISRILRPGGIGCICAPYAWPFHEHPIDCWRIFPEGMRTVLVDAGLTALRVYTKELSSTHGDTIAIFTKPDVASKKKRLSVFSELEMLYQAAKDTPSDIHQHMDRLRKLGEDCAFITEFGTRTGVSTLAWLSAKPNKLICYDIHRCADMDMLERVANEDGIIFSFRLEDVLAATIEATDLLFIDTLHVYDQLRMELARHSAQVRKYIVLHDTETFGQAGELPGTLGLWPAVEEFLVAHPEWEILERHSNNNGLTVLARRSTP